jgi:hypothetical protein
VNLLYAQTGYHLYDTMANQVSAGDRRALNALALKYRDQTNNEFRNLWMPKPIEQANLTTD